MIVKTKIDDTHWNYDVDQRDILYIEQDADYAKVVMLNSSIRIHGTMERIAKLFPMLSRAHRSWLVNPYQMRAYVANTDPVSVSILFKNGQKITIGKGRNYYDDFVASFQKASEEQGNSILW